MGSEPVRGVLEPRDGNAASKAARDPFASGASASKDPAGSAQARQERLSSVAVAARREVEGLRRERSQLHSHLAQLSCQVRAPEGYLLRNPLPRPPYLYCCPWLSATGGLIAPRSASGLAGMAGDEWAAQTLDPTELPNDERALSQATIRRLFLHEWVAMLLIAWHLSKRAMQHPNVVRWPPIGAHSPSAGG